LELKASAHAGAASESPAVGAAHRAPRKLAIDAVALQGLADDLGYEVTIDGGDTVRFALAAP
jgi:hypothetical protein